jgi:mono/diheme cytochrome c family protein
MSHTTAQPPHLMDAGQIAATLPLVSSARKRLAQLAALRAATLLAAALMTGALLCPASEAAETELTFERHVRPILKAHCFHCHGEADERQGGLDVRLVRTLTTGGDSGTAIDRANSEDSLLWRRVAADEMPEGPKKLSDSEKAILQKWLALGAPTARPEPEDPNEVRFTEEELEHWAFQPLRDAPPPRPDELTPNSDAPRDSDALLAGPTAIAGQTAIDAFIADRLTEHGLRFSPEADRATLLRRVTYDLTGLPPTPEEVTEFLSDATPQAWERVVDRLLSSPQYGVRWGRNWLDVAGYAESDGIVGKDRVRPHAWRYRDYVIHAMNSDKPYDQFLTEQLAGDEMLEGPRDVNNPRHVELLAATGFLRMAPDTTEVENNLNERNQAVAETIKVVGSAVLGLTVGCAQCHDHRYDPVSIEDYYRLRAVFDPAFPLQHWRRPSERLIDLTDDATRQEIQRIEDEAVKVDEEIKQRRHDHCQAIQDREINAAPEEIRQELRTAIDTEEAKRSPEQKALLDKWPKVRTIGWIIGQLVEYDQPAFRKFEEEFKQVEAIRATKPLARMIMAVDESRDRVPQSVVFFRGDPASPKHPVEPGELPILTRGRDASLLPRTVSDQLQTGETHSAETSSGEAQSDATPSQPPTTGRRLAYARQLTDGTHPLVARVAVNRIWQQYFGRGLAPNTGDFGFAGQPPSHPELLDYLALDFMRGGWKMKRLHKQIVMSRTYRQTSRRDGDADPENIWLSRMPLRRLEAEALRDAMLVVSGALNGSIDGPSVPVGEDGEGKTVIGKRLLRDGLYAGIEPAGEQEFRRSVYISTPRTLALDMLETFDLPAMTPNCTQRSTSTVATQALWLMNDKQMIALSDRMAETVWASSPADASARIRLAWMRAFAVQPSASEVERFQQFIEQQAERFRQDSNAEWQKTLAETPEAAERRALAGFCQVLLSSNRMLYIP